MQEQTGLPPLGVDGEPPVERAKGQGLDIFQRMRFASWIRPNVHLRGRLVHRRQDEDLRPGPLALFLPNIPLAASDLERS